MFLVSLTMLIRTKQKSRQPKKIEHGIKDPLEKEMFELSITGDINSLENPDLVKKELQRLKAEEKKYMSQDMAVIEKSDIAVGVVRDMLSQLGDFHEIEVEAAEEDKHTDHLKEPVFESDHDKALYMWNHITSKNLHQKMNFTKFLDIFHHRDFVQLMDLHTNAEGYGTHYERKAKKETNRWFLEHWTPEFLNYLFKKAEHPSGKTKRDRKHEEREMYFKEFLDKEKSLKEHTDKIEKVEKKLTKSGYLKKDSKHSKVNDITERVLKEHKKGKKLDDKQLDDLVDLHEHEKIIESDLDRIVNSPHAVKHSPKIQALLDKFKSDDIWTRTHKQGYVSINPKHFMYTRLWMRNPNIFPYNDFPWSKLPDYCQKYLHKMSDMMAHLYTQEHCDTVDFLKRDHKHGFIRVLNDIKPDDELMKTVHEKKQKMALHDPSKLISDDVDEHEVDQTIHKIFKENEKHGYVDPRDLAKPYADEYLPHRIIPNLYHVIWFGCRTFNFHNFISLVSVIKIAKPAKMMFYTNCEPNNELWKTFRCFAGSLLMIVPTQPPKNVWGHRIENHHHQKDVYKLMLLLHIGGVYMEPDTVMIQPVTELGEARTKEALLPVFGEESSFALSDDFIMSPPHSKFLKRIYWEYQHYNQHLGFGTLSIINEWAMWRKHPTEVKVVKKRMNRPNAMEQAYLFKCLMDWRYQYTINMHSRHFKKWLKSDEEFDLIWVARKNNTLAEISRYIIWGKPEPIRKDCEANLEVL